MEEALAKVCKPAHVFEVVVPKANVSVPAEVIVPPCRGYVVATEVTVPDPAPTPIQVPLTAKHPVARLIPPVLENVEVAVLKLIPFVLPTEKIEPGVLVPIPTLPLESIVSAVVVADALGSAKTENRERLDREDVAVTVSRERGEDVEIPKLPVELFTCI